ncbi:MAG: D-alanyl-D-alanine carboxypeptidase, partial [Burkholderiales bacterium]|nr:D-alanyl-D-alanine carboxypeptidase [Burkholderiales bacterium]
MMSTAIMLERKASMRFITIAAAWIFVLAFAFPARAQTPLPAPVAQALAKAGIPESGAAFYVHEIGAAQPLVSHGAEQALNPASTMKLVTTYAALDLLGPAYAWSTEIYAAGELLQDAVVGDL